MKEKTKLQKIIKEILDVVKKHSITAEQVRYVFKHVREKGNFQIKKAIRKLPVYLNEAEVYTCRKAILGYLSVKHSFAFDFLLGTGLRVGEFCNLLITDLDFSANTIRVSQAKGNKTGERYVPFPLSLQSRTKDFIKGRKRGYVFAKNDNTKYTTRAVQHMMSKVFKYALLSKSLHTHSLRHTYATILRSNGVSIQDIQLYLGHEKIETTEIYAHLVFNPEQQKKIMNIFDDNKLLR